MMGCSKDAASPTACSRGQVSHMAIYPQCRLFPGGLEFFVLLKLRPRGLHGYALAQAIQSASNNLIRVEGGNLYQALRRLHKAKLIDVRCGISSGNRRIQIYKLTASGEEHLVRELPRIERMLEGVTTILASASAPYTSSSPAVASLKDFQGGHLPASPRSSTKDWVERHADSHVPVSPSAQTSSE
jgi:DNA-binding PadR family transcriptional regulator